MENGWKERRAHSVWVVRNKEVISGASMQRWDTEHPRQGD